MKSAGALGGAGWLRLSAPAIAGIAQAACTAKREEAPFVTLGRDEAADFAAIAARIIPSTDTPGATEAGVVYFFDRAFGDEMQDDLPFARAGLAGLNDGLAQSRFSSLSADDQDDALRAIEDGPFFGLVRYMTLVGFFAMSRYGGNADHVAWNLIGFEGERQAWQYPFGYYDAAIHTSDD